jgi:hypothetical protein
MRRWRRQLAMTVKDGEHLQLSRSHLTRSVPACWNKPNPPLLIGLMWQLCLFVDKNETSTACPKAQTFNWSSDDSNWSSSIPRILKSSGFSRCRDYFLGVSLKFFDMHLRLLVLEPWLGMTPSLQRRHACYHWRKCLCSGNWYFITCYCKLILPDTLLSIWKGWRMRKPIGKVTIFLHCFNPLIHFADFMLFLTSSAAYTTGDSIESAI